VAERGQTFTLPQVARISGVQYRTLHLWLRRGLLRVSVKETHGAGVSNVLDVGDLFEACVLADLRRAGLSMDALERAAAALRDYELKGDEVLVMNGSVTILARGADITGAALASTPAVVYDLQRARARVSGAD
jgi:hypothetical protein